MGAWAHGHVCGEGYTIFYTTGYQSYSGNFLEVARHPYIAYGRCPPNTIFAADTRHCFVNVLGLQQNQSGGIVFFPGHLAGNFYFGGQHLENTPKID